jgi:hypothetical protein
VFKQNNAISVSESQKQSLHLATDLGTIISTLGLTGFGYVHFLLLSLRKKNYDTETSASDNV